ncbi:hypothetical protein B484DRAFT_406793 [Ochromonadaceae sp. CCMP2298]|nr:hypothetical protein B484DRAFT_406793 [Ochromonadaceae sp. CCMP2298]
MQSPAGVSGKMQLPAGVSGKMQLPAGVSGKMQLPAGVSGKMQLPSRRTFPTPSPQLPAAACPRSLRAPCSCAPTGQWGKGKRVGGGVEGAVGAQPLPPALSGEQRDELLQELREWSRANSLFFLQARYGDQPEKLEELLSGEGMEGIGGVSGDMSGGMSSKEVVPVPMLELRQWLVAKGETIALVYADA